MSKAEARKTLKLFIVDDNPAIRRLIRLLVADLVDEIVECADGLEAVRLYREQRPDWVLMDIEMSGMDGVRATREIRGSFPDARVIIVTSYDDRAYRAATSAAGALAYVTKENLLELRRLLSASDADPEPGPAGS
jgi:CheY-like chemotaxis protein